MKEGCLSFPDMYVMIKRSKVIELKYQDSEGKDHSLTLEGMAARCVQHECDHLNGIIFLQRASRLKIERALKVRAKERTKRIEYEDNKWDIYPDTREYKHLISNVTLKLFFNDKEQYQKLIKKYPQ